jgi:hypothetical protein
MQKASLGYRKLVGRISGRPHVLVSAGHFRIIIADSFLVKLG